MGRHWSSIAEAERCLHMLDDQLASSGGILCSVSVAYLDAPFPYCACLLGKCDISAMSHLLAWIEMLHQRPSFSTGLTVPFLGLDLQALRMQHRRKSRWRLRVTPANRVISKSPQLSCQASRLHESWQKIG